MSLANFFSKVMSSYIHFWGVKPIIRGVIGTWIRWLRITLLLILFLSKLCKFMVRISSSMIACLTFNTFTLVFFIIITLNCIVFDFVLNTPVPLLLTVFHRFPCGTKPGNRCWMYWIDPSIIVSKFFVFVI